MNISCDMAMDLIALYNDGVASEDSRQAIREHLKGCPDCRRAFAEYSAERKKAAEERIARDDVSEKYTLLAKHLRRNHMISTATVMSVVAISLLVGSFGTLRLLTRNEADDE
ncbi:MAG: hypothetical protein HFE63_07275 [Clostridiales bacterium]|nr:hypothetical protein [Clostridiales bacterium]